MPGATIEHGAFSTTYSGNVQHPANPWMDHQRKRSDFLLGAKSGALAGVHAHSAN